MWDSQDASEMYIQGDDSEGQDASCCSALHCSHTFHNKTTRPSYGNLRFALRAFYLRRASALPVLWSFQVRHKVQEA